MRGRREPDATVFLVGFMGAGKTAVGKALASARSWGFEDTDAAVEIALGRAIPEIFNELGEGAFREAESAALRMVAGRPRTVVATGGGLFLSLAHRAVVRAAVSPSGSTPPSRSPPRASKVPPGVPSGRARIRSRGARSTSAAGRRTRSRICASTRIPRDPRTSRARYTTPCVRFAVDFF